NRASLSLPPGATARARARARGEPARTLPLLHHDDRAARARGGVPRRQLARDPAAVRPVANYCERVNGLHGDRSHELPPHMGQGGSSRRLTATPYPHSLQRNSPITSCPVAKNST